MVSDIPKFVEGTINDLMVFLESRNAGRRHHWMDLLIDEKVEQLKLCGVTVEIRALESADRVH